MARHLKFACGLGGGGESLLEIIRHALIRPSARRLIAAFVRRLWNRQAADDIKSGTLVARRPERGDWLAGVVRRKAAQVGRDVRFGAAGGVLTAAGACLVAIGAWMPWQRLVFAPCGPVPGCFPGAVFMVGAGMPRSQIQDQVAVWL